jgi:hypothetical protein
MKIRLSFWGKAVTALFLVLALGVFFGCDTTTNGDPPQRFGPKVTGAEFSGTWSSTGSYGTDSVAIDTAADPMTFTYWFGTTPDYSGSYSMDYTGIIEGEIAEDPDLLKCEWGYIIIKITNSGSYAPSVGKYHGIHWENLSASSVREGGAAKDPYTDKGKDTLAAAVAEYTVENGYFGNHGTYLPAP